LITLAERSAGSRKLRLGRDTGLFSIHKGLEAGGYKGMKITTDGLAAGSQVQNARQREKTSQRFDEILTTMENQQPTSIDKASPSQPAFQIAPVVLDPTDNDGLLRRLDDSLTLLESYQSKLSDSTVPAHELQEDIDRLEDQTSGLQSEFSSLPGDHPMKDLLNRSIVTMTVEIEKYRRGDFG
jgi:hypothetical protein